LTCTMQTDDKTIHLIILGDPKHQKRHRTTKIQTTDGREFNRRYDPSAGDKQDILRVVQAGAPPKPFDCPLRVELHLFYPRPKSHYRTGQYAGELKPNAPQWHTKKPDRDNADKIILDALSKVFWRDDCLVCDGRIVKRYSERPRTEIYITPVVQEK